MVSKAQNDAMHAAQWAGQAKIEADGAKGLAENVHDRRMAEAISKLSASVQLLADAVSAIVKATGA